MTPYIQTKLIERVTRQLQERTGLELSVGKVDFRPLETIVLENVLLRDDRQDTLFFAGRLFAGLDSVRLMHRTFTVKELRLDRAFLNYRARETTLDLLRSLLATGDTTGAPGWKVNLSRVELRDCRVNYREERARPTRFGINWSDVACREVNAVVRAIDLSDGGFRARVEGLSLTEKSGFKLNELTADVDARSARLLVSSALIRAGNSRLHLDTLAYEWIANAGYWRDFVRKMPQRYVFSDAEVYLDDLAYFNEELRDMHHLVAGSGEVCNTVANLTGKHLDVRLGEKTRLRAAFRSAGLPRLANARFEIEVEEARLSPAELRAIYLPWIENHYLPLPRALDRFDTFIISGRVAGAIDDLSAEARSAAPGLAGEVGVTYRADSSGYRYDGSLRLHRVDYALLSGQEFLGNGSFEGTFSGQRQQVDAFNLKGEARRLRLLDAELRDVQLSARGEGDRYDVSASVDNDSIRARIDAVYETSDSCTSIGARGEVSLREWNSWAPELFAGQESVAARFAGQWQTRGDSALANLRVAPLGYSNERGSITIDALLFAHAADGERGRTTLSSDIVDAKIEGNYLGIRPDHLLDHLLYTYFPSHENAAASPTLRDLDLDCSLTLKNADSLLAVVFPDLSLSDRVDFSAKREKSGRIRLECSADSIQWGMLQVTRPALKLSGNTDSIASALTAARLHYNGVGTLYNLRDVAEIKPDRVSNELTWNNWGRETYSGALSFDVGLSKYGERRVMQLLVQPGVIIIGDTVWRVERSLILREQDNFFINNFEVTHGDQRFRLKGRVGENPRDTLLVQFENLKLADVSRVMPGKPLPLFGTLNGSVRVQDLYRDRLFYTNIELANWGFARDTIGTINANTHWDAREKLLRVDVANRVNDRVPLSASGHYDPATNRLNLQCILSSLEAKQLTSYFPDALGEGSGAISGILTIDGPSSEPLLDGYLEFDRVTIPVTPIHTTYLLDKRLDVKNSRLIFDQLQLRDNNNNQVNISGFYDAKKGQHDVNLQFNDFMIINAAPAPDEFLHGQLAVSGRARIHDDDGATAIVANLKTARGSRLFVPLGSTGLDDEYNFLHFVNTPRNATATPTARQGGNTPPAFDLNIAVEIANNLELQLIFDPTVGDILKSVGRGNLHLAIDKDNRTTLFGDYAIEQGEYLFTMGNLINKQFVLQPGGNIAWNGNLTNATIDVTALYPLRTSLGDLVQEAVSDWNAGDYNTKIPVECTLHLTDNLMNPTVNFGIEFPSLDARTRGTLQGLLDSPDEINKQVFALLIMNRFYPKDAQEAIGDAGYQTGVATASEMLSRQFSRWLSRLTSNLDVGVAYRPGDQESNNEFEIALSTRVWNDRVSISVNGNVIEGNKNSGQTPVTGDFDVDVKLNPPGTLKLKAYSHTDTKITYNATETIQGIGVSYQENFDTLRELIQSYLGIFKSKKRETP
ncbi:MAG: translocation/assembly module TamB [Odoribacteraceae bacterium]|nr:translocation/assembly module TamB [Odoribacteraceae bacterium]